jgi:hypothetical protein
LSSAARSPLADVGSIAQFCRSAELQRLV